MERMTGPHVGCILALDEHVKVLKCEPKPATSLLLLSWRVAENHTHSVVWAVQQESNTCCVLF
jgi:hypothetical protein